MNTHLFTGFGGGGGGWRGAKELFTVLGVWVVAKKIINDNNKRGGKGMGTSSSSSVYTKPRHIVH